MRTILQAALLLLFSEVYTQTVLNLNDCMKYAFEHNFELLEYSNIIHKNNLNLRQSYLNLLPSAKTIYNHNLSSGRSLNVETYSWENEDIQQGDIALSAELVVFSGLYNLYNKKASQIVLDKSKLVLLQKKLLLSLEITVLYHKITLTNSNINILEITNSNTLKEIKKLKNQILAGTMAKSNIYELEAQAKKEKLEILALLNEKDKQIINLAKLINWQKEIPLQLNTNLLPVKTDKSILVDSSYILDIVINKSVITSIAKREMELANKAIQIKKSYLFPNLTLNTSFSSRYLKNAIDPISSENNYTCFNQLDNNQYKQLAITLTIPLFNRYQNATEIKQLKIDFENKKLQLEEAKLQLKSELENIQTDISYLEKKIQETKEMVDDYKKSYDVATEKYRSGLLDSYTLNASKNNYTTSMLQYNRLKIELSMNIELLRLYSEFIVN